MRQTIMQAIENMQLLEFDYDGGTRIVEPHCYGLTTKGNEAIRAYQVDGYSSSGKMGWKLYDLSKASSINLLDQTFASPRDGYSQGDRGMSEIFIEL